MNVVEIFKMQNSGRNSRQLRASTPRILRNSAVAGLLAVLGGCSTVPAAFDNEALQTSVSSEKSAEMPARELATHEPADPLLVAKARTLAEGATGEVTPTGAGGSSNTQALVAKAKAMAQRSANTIPESGAVDDATDQMMIVRAQALVFNNSGVGGPAQPQGLPAAAAPQPQATFRHEAIARSEAIGGRMPPEEVLTRLKALSSASNPHEPAQADNSASRGDRSDARSASQGNDLQTARLEPDQTLQRLRELAAQSKAAPNAAHSEAPEPPRSPSTTVASAVAKSSSADALKQATATGGLSQWPTPRERSAQASAAQKPFSILGGGLRAAALQPGPQSSSILTR